MYIFDFRFLDLNWPCIFRESHKSLDELDFTEIDTISQLDHPNIVRIFDIVWHINSGAGVELYLVYQFCNLGDLNVYLTDHGKMEEPQIQDFVRQMSSGMSILRFN